MEIDTHISFMSGQAAVESQRRGMKKFFDSFFLNAKESNKLKTDEQQTEKTKQQSVLYLVRRSIIIIIILPNILNKLNKSNIQDTAKREKP